MTAAESTKKRTPKPHDFIAEVKKSRVLFLMILPTLLFYFIFSYIPMAGVYFAFTRYNFSDGMFGSPFVGLENFKILFDQGTLSYLTSNTILYNLAFILIGNVTQIAAAITLSRLGARWFKRLSQSLIFLPYFVSYVIVQAFSYALFNSGTGAVTVFVRSMGAEGFAPFSTPGLWKYIIVVAYLWKNIGYGMVIYLAAITGISDDYYEAAQIDGANIWQQVRYITLPLLIPTFIILLLLAIGGILRGQFELFYQLVGQEGQLYSATDILDTFVFRQLRGGRFEIGIGTAVGLYQSVFGFIIIMTVNSIVKRNHEEYALF